MLPHQKVTLGSLFSGVEGLGMGIESALRDEGFDAETTFQVENDEFCRRVLARHYPAALRFDDVRTVGAHPPYAHVLPRVDVLHGGSPCTDLSLAGARGGLAGERSGLWGEQARLVRELRPRVAVWENVPGARTPVRRDGVVVEQPALGTVLGDFSSFGYDAVWFTVRAADVGAPHLRERIFVVAWDRSLVEHTDDGGRGAQRVGGVGRTVGVGGNDPDEPATPANANQVAHSEFGEGGQRRDVDVLGRRSRHAEQTRVGGGRRDRRSDPAQAGVADADLAGLEGRSVRDRERASQRTIGEGGGEVADDAEFASDERAHDSRGDRQEPRQIQSRGGDGASGAGSGSGTQPRLGGEPRRSAAWVDDPDPRDGEAPLEMLGVSQGDEQTPEAVLPSVPREPRDVDRHDVTAHRWPAGPGEAQHAWEAPRVTTKKRDRADRLRSLGNIVVPQVAYVVGHVVAWALRLTASGASCGASTRP